MVIKVRKKIKIIKNYNKKPFGTGKAAFALPHRLTIYMESIKFNLALHSNIGNSANDGKRNKARNIN